ncbi:Leucine-rich repeat domain superfamily protein [Abortiporus biennis]
MHHIFLIEEILRKITENIIDKKNGDSRIALTAFARTCRAVSDAALDSLWYYQADIIPVTRTLGAALGTRLDWDHLLGRNRTTLVLSRNVLPSERSRFELYAKRIRVLGVAFGIRELDVDDTVIKHLIQWSFPLFPNLENLTWPVQGISHNMKMQLSTFSMFISPRLRNFHLSLANSTQLSQMLFSSLHEQCPNLITLTMQGRFELNGVSTLEDYLRNALQLQHLSIKAQLPYKLTSTIAILPHLTHLCIRTYCRPSDLKEPTLLTAFPALRVLNITSEDLQTLFRFMTAFTFPTLSNLIINIEVEEFYMESRFSELVHLISNKCSPENLLSVFIHSVDTKTRRSLNDDRIPPIRGDTLQPLLRFHKMEQFYVNSLWYMSLDDDLLQSLAQSWPKLVSLELFQNGTWTKSASSITLKGLLPLAQHCCDLRKLGIHLDAENNEPPSVTADLSSFEKVQQLSLGCSLIGEPVDKYMPFIEHLFPSVRSVDAWASYIPGSICPGDGEIYGGRWDAIEHKLIGTSSFIQSHAI